MAVVTDLADAVVAELNAATFSQPVSAVRKYVPIADLKQMQALHVTVVPKGVSIEALARDRSQREYQIDLAVQKKFSTGDNTEIDPLVALAEEIADYLRHHRLGSYPNAFCLKTQHQPIYSPEHFDQLRQFTSILTLTYRVA